uniref:DUF3108 domain-containing protein n=1 Tax=candidate division WOR-3 bacterium TaxID=2052148 RepID=A0A7V5XZ41_UNCW3
MRYFKFLTLMFIFIFFFSCHKKEQVINPNAKDYFPLATGNYWEYKVRYFEIEGSDTTEYEESDTVRIEVGEKRPIKGKEYFYVDVDNYVRTEDEFILILACDLSYEDTLFYHTHIQDGDPWYVKGDEWESGIPPYVARYVGKEVINLPVGSFDCIKIEYYNRDLLSWFYFMEGDHYDSISFWFGKGVGIVKINGETVYEEDEKDVLQWELINYKVKK